MAFPADKKVVTDQTPATTGTIPITDDKMDIKRDSSNSAKSPSLAGSAVETLSYSSIDPKVERSVVWKFDLRLLPVLAVMDKSNLGNAKTAGLEKSLNLSVEKNQFSTIFSVFFILYVFTALFIGLVGKKYGPNRVLPIMMSCFGCCTLLVVAAHNFAGIMTLR